MRYMFCILLLIGGLCGCTRVEFVPAPVCPYGPPYMLPSDYDTLTNTELISDMFADWVIANGLFCEETGKLKT